MEDRVPPTKDLEELLKTHSIRSNERLIWLQRRHFPQKVPEKHYDMEEEKKRLVEQGICANPHEVSKFIVHAMITHGARGRITDKELHELIDDAIRAHCEKVKE